MKTFQELDLIAPVQRALVDEKYETPTPIQAQTIPPALEGRDVLGCAQTGTGKTAAFALPILDRLGKRNRKAAPNHPHVLVLAPTRELAIQIGDSFATYGRHLQLRYALVYGGVNQGKQVRAMKRGAHVLVATPGRLIDLMNQGHIELGDLEVFVLDEADRMLDMGFLPDLKRIIAQLPERRQSLFFSATLAPKIVELANGLLRDPVSVNVTPKQTSVERIEQRVLYVARSGKKELLERILVGKDCDRALVFTRTKRGANALAGQLERSGIRATAIHGNKSQAARQKALEAFRRKQVKVLVATDVAARGIDIDGITHVVNFDLPVEPENYVHRIGRTGRAGAEGIALSFCTAEERGDLKAIERLIGQRVPVCPDSPESEPTGPVPAPSPRGRAQRPSARPSRKRSPGARHAASKANESSRPAKHRSSESSGGPAKKTRNRRRKTRRAAESVKNG